MKAPLIHVASLLFNEPLAIMPAKLETILRAIGPRLVVDDAALNELLQGHSIGQRPILLEDAVLFDAQAPRQNGGENEKPYRLTPEGVAIIPMRGSLMKRYNFLAAASGLTTYQGLAQAATAAMADPQVKAILFDVDSPGGTTHGCFELSDAIYKMRGDKPMWACANDLAASAAYALASAADQLWVTRTGGVGSVGVFALHADQSDMDEQAGVKFTYIFAGDKKIDGNPHEPLSKSARADIQAEVDREHNIFIATVARNRGGSINFEKIQATKAGVYFAQNAVPLLADEVGTFEDALEALTTKVNGTKAISSGKVAILNEPGNNAQSKGTEVEKEGVNAMPKPGEELLRRAKKADDEAQAAAEPKDDEDDDDQPEDDEKPKEDAKKGKKAAARAIAPNQDDEDDDRPAHRDPAADAKRIATLCQIAGAPELAADYLIKGYDVDKVVEKLSARRAKASAEGNVNSFVSDGTGSGSSASVDSAIEQARIMSANSGGKLSQSQCMERILRANPDIYNGYLEERGKVAAQVAFTGGGRALTDYVMNNQRRYMANLGLGTTIENVPSRRSM